MKKYEIDFFFEYGESTPPFLWARSEYTENAFGNPISVHKLPIEEDTKKLLFNLSKEFQASLNWISPLDPSPWAYDKKQSFYQRVENAFFTNG